MRFYDTYLYLYKQGFSSSRAVAFARPSVHIALIVNIGMTESFCYFQTLPDVSCVTAMYNLERAATLHICIVKKSLLKVNFKMILLVYMILIPKDEQPYMFIYNISNLLMINSGIGHGGFFVQTSK